MVHDKEFNPMNSRIHRIRIEPVINNALNCLKCYDPSCVKACQLNALSKNNENGNIIVDETKCDGCGACIRNCPYGVIQIHTKNRKAIVCDLCESTESNTPQCVEICPKGAIFVEEIDPDVDEDRLVTLSKIIKRGFPGSGMLN
jgi:Fe-S-cluster-containing dehydrogenase component